MAGLAVGLAVGIPSAVIIIFVAIFWLRNNRKQRREDEIQDEIDMDLRGNESFDHFESELHKPYRNQVPEPIQDPPTPSSTDNNHTANTHASEKQYISSNGSSTSTNTIEPKKALNLPQAPIHQFAIARNPKPSSSYDFYDSFIPVLPSNGASSSAHDVAPLPPPPVVQDVASTHASSSESVVVMPQDKSLDNLAKQLTAPTFFEKLPSRAAPVVLKNRGNNSYLSTANNSSSDLIANRLVNETSAINEHFIYEANGVEVKPKQVGAVDIDNSFDREAGIVANDLSPFHDDREGSDISAPGVIFR